MVPVLHIPCFCLSCVKLRNFSSILRIQVHFKHECYTDPDFLPQSLFKFTIIAYQMNEMQGCGDILCKLQMQSLLHHPLKGYGFPSMVTKTLLSI